MVGHASVVYVLVEAASFDSMVSGRIGLGVFVNESLKVFSGGSERADDNIGAGAAIFGHIAHRIGDLSIRSIVDRAFFGLLFGRDEDFVCGWGGRFGSRLFLASCDEEEKS